MVLSRDIGAMSGLFCDRNVMLHRNSEKTLTYFLIPGICSYFDYHIWKHLVLLVTHSTKLTISLYTKTTSVRKS